jgi:hypothetical protein
MKWSQFFVASAVLGLSACTTYQGPPSNPIERSLTWFSFVAGDDFRAECRSGGPDRYRFVYNAIYKVQIRAYELTPTPNGAELSVRARGRSGIVNRFNLNNPFGPWEMLQSRAEIDNPTAAGIVDAFAAAVASSPPSAGQQFDSNEYYWIVASCSGGNFALNGFVDPKVDINALEFPKRLLAHDDSGVPFRKAEFVEGFREDVFTLQINRTGDNLTGRL